MSKKETDSAAGCGGLLIIIGIITIIPVIQSIGLWILAPFVIAFFIWFFKSAQSSENQEPPNNPLSASQTPAEPAAQQPAFKQSSEEMRIEDGRPVSRNNR